MLRGLSVQIFNSAEYITSQEVVMYSETSAFDFNKVLPSMTFTLNSYASELLGEIGRMQSEL